MPRLVSQLGEEVLGLQLPLVLSEEVSYLDSLAASEEFPLFLQPTEEDLVPRHVAISRGFSTSPSLRFLRRIYTSTH